MRTFLLLAILPLASGCGAGVIGGVFASKRQPGTTEVRSASIDPPSFAYLGQQGARRQVTIAGYEAPATGRLRIAIRVPALPGAVTPFYEFEQPSSQVSQVSPRLTRIDFLVNSIPVTRALLDEGRDLTAEDVSAQVIVRVDDIEVVPPIPITIHKLMRASLQFSRNGATEETLSTAGGSEFACRVRGFPASNTNFTVDLLTFDPNTSGQWINREVDNVRVEPVPGTDEVVLKVTAPSHTFPCRVFASVRHPWAGQSLPIDTLYYRAEIAFAVPRTAIVDRGSRVLLVGAGLVPLRFFDESRPAEPDYDRIEVWLEKGQRRSLAVPIQQQQPSLSRLSFEVPPSPDGRRGLATILLRANLRDASGQGAVVESRATDLIAYGDVAPVFGPRGIVLQASPTHVAFGDIEGDGEGVDAVACSGLQPTVHFMVSSNNGMFQRFGPPLIAGSTQALLERSPERLVVDDADRNGIADVLVLNGGNGVTATHTLLMGKAAPALPLVAGGPAMSSVASARASVKGDFDGNGLVDVVVLPRLRNAVPEICLSFGDSQLGPRYVVNQLTQVFDFFDVVEADDFDRDGRLDLAFARGGIDPALLTLYGQGNGTFVPGVSLELSRQIPGYVPSEASKAVGLHVCGDANLKGLALILEGTYQPATRATIAVLDYVDHRRHEVPSAARTTVNQSGVLFKRTLSADLDGDGIRELVIAGEINVQAVLVMYAWRTPSGEPTFVEHANSIDLGEEPFLTVSDLAYGSTGQREGGADGRAVFVTHRYLFSDESRIATLIAQGQGNSLRLLPPDARQALPYQVNGLALGRFRGAATPRSAADLVVASAGTSGGALRGIEFFANDGVGGQRSRLRVDMSLLPGTVTAVPRAAGDLVACLDRGRVLRVVQPASSNATLVQSIPLDPYLPASLRMRDLQERSKLVVADVDGDGITDVVALLMFEPGLIPADEDGQLFVLFGRSTTLATEFPFVLPNPAFVHTATADDEARDLVVGEFSASPRGWLEVAVSVGGGDNHVRFYRVDRTLDPSASRSLRRSFASASEPALIAGDDPDRLATGDIDGDGISELAVTSRTTAGDKLRLFFNTAFVGDEVDIALFRPVLGAAQDLPRGTTHIFLRDLSGDGLADLLVAAMVTSNQTTTNQLHHYLGTGTGQFTNEQILHQLRTGDQRWESGYVLRNARMRLVVGELNGDASVDLVIGWPTFGAAQRNVYGLFGGAR